MLYIEIIPTLKKTYKFYNSLGGILLYLILYYL